MENEKDTINQGKPSEYGCKICPKSYKSLKSLNNHLKVHGHQSTQKVLKCKLCGTGFKYTKTLQKHEAVCTSKYFCSICSVSFHTLADLEKHKAEKHPPKVKKKRCRICSGTTFDTEEDYLYHIKEVHNGKYIDYLICEDCGKQFRTKSELRYHIDSKCGTVKRFKCKVCNQELMTAGSLHNHLLRHSGERFFMCRFCAKFFLTAGQLKVHERKHTQEKVFLCNVCGKGFCHRQSLITHSTLHTGIKPYQCENCGNSFSCIGNLLKHRKSHADTCGSVPLTTHRVNNPSTRIKVKVNTPSTSKLKVVKKDKEIEAKLRDLQERKTRVFNNEDAREKQSIEATTQQHVINNFEVNIRDTGDERAFEDSGDVKNYGHMARNDANITDLYHQKVGEPENEINRRLDVNDDQENGCFDNDIETDSEDSIDLATQDNRTRANSQEIKPEICDNDEEICKGSKLKHENKGKRQKRKSKNSIKVTNEEVEEFVKQRAEKKNECQFCGKIIYNPKWLLKHEKCHQILKKIYYCSCCHESFESKEDCKVHQESEHADILTCQECDKIFSSKDCLKTHQKITHEKLPRKSYSYICEKCGKEFKQKQTLLNHKESLCGTSLVYECEICHKKFTSIYIRRNHMKVHDTKKLLCKFCGKSFHWKGQLKVHERSHTGEKPYTCLYCPKAFSYRESLLTHSTIHTGIKPYVCESCGYGFSCIGNLIKHKDSHANVCGTYNKKQP